MGIQTQSQQDLERTKTIRGAVALMALGIIRTRITQGSILVTTTKGIVALVTKDQLGSGTFRITNPIWTKEGCLTKIQISRKGTCLTWETTTTGACFRIITLKEVLGLINPGWCSRLITVQIFKAKITTRIISLTRDKPLSRCSTPRTMNTTPCSSRKSLKETGTILKGRNTISFSSPIRILSSLWTQITFFTQRALIIKKHNVFNRSNRSIMNSRSSKIKSTRSSKYQEKIKRHWKTTYRIRIARSLWISRNTLSF